MTLREKVDAALLCEMTQLPRATFDGEVGKFSDAAIRAVLEWAEEVAGRVNHDIRNPQSPVDFVQNYLKREAGI